MSLQRLPPDQALDKADKALTPEKPYSKQLLAEAWRSWKGQWGVRVIASTLAAIVIPWLKAGSFWHMFQDTGVWVIATFILTLIFTYVLELLRAPFALDKKKRQEIAGLNENVKLLHGEIAEHKRVKVTFEVSTAIWESTILLTDSGDTEDWRDATVFVMEAKLFIRYFNDDMNPVRIHRFRLSICNDETGSEYAFEPGFIRPVFREPDATENHYFVGFVIPGNTLTDHYYHQFSFDVPPECALSVDRNSYLRVTLDAAKQDPYSVDLDVPWNAARRGDATISIRPSPA